MSQGQEVLLYCGELESESIATRIIVYGTIVKKEYSGVGKGLDLCVRSQRTHLEDLSIDDPQVNDVGLYTDVRATCLIVQASPIDRGNWSEAQLSKSRLLIRITEIPHCLSK